MAELSTNNEKKSFVTLGLFIIDEFSFTDEEGNPTGQTLEPQGRGGTYAAIGARIWLPPSQVGMIVDEGHDFPETIKHKLADYGKEMWMFRKQPHHLTTRAINSYRGEIRGFDYKTPRIRISPKDLAGTDLAFARTLHFICSPTRASVIISEVRATEGWNPIIVYEPIPDRCVPEEMPALKEVLPFILILSPNAEEALSLLSLPLPPSKDIIEVAADNFLDFGIGKQDDGWIVIRSGAMGAYIKSHSTKGIWVDAFWNSEHSDKIIDVTGAGNSFLGGFAAGMALSGDVCEATMCATVSASFIIEQEGLPSIKHVSPSVEIWNGDDPLRRLEILRKRQNNTN